MIFVVDGQGVGGKTKKEKKTGGGSSGSGSGGGSPPPAPTVNPTGSGNPAIAAILRDYNNYKIENPEVDRNDKDALKEKMKEEEEKAKKHLDDQVKQDQEDNQKFKDWVNENRNVPPEEKTPSITLSDGKKFVWSGAPGSGVRNPPRPDPESVHAQVVAEAVAENERIIRETLENGQFENDGHLHVTEWAGKLEGLTLLTQTKLQKDKDELAKINQRIVENNEKRKEYNDACIPEWWTEYKKATGWKEGNRMRSGTFEFRGMEVKTYIRVHGRSKKTGEGYTRPRRVSFRADYPSRTCNALFDKYENEISPADIRRRDMLRAAVEGGSSWTAKFQLLLRWFNVFLQWDRLTPAAVITLRQKVAETSKLIEAALRAGFSATNYQIRDLQKALTASLDKAKAWEKERLQDAENQGAEIEPPAGEIPIGPPAPPVQPPEPKPAPGINLVEFARIVQEGQPGVDILAQAFGKAMWPDREHLLGIMREWQAVQMQLAKESLQGRVERAPRMKEQAVRKEVERIGRLPPNRWNRGPR